MISQINHCYCPCISFCSIICLQQTIGMISIRALSKVCNMRLYDGVPGHLPISSYSLPFPSRNCEIQAIWCSVIYSLCLIRPFHRGTTLRIDVRDEIKWITSRPDNEKRHRQTDYTYRRFYGITSSTLTKWASIHLSLWCSCVLDRFVLTSFSKRLKEWYIRLHALRMVFIRSRVWHSFHNLLHGSFRIIKHH